MDISKIPAGKKVPEQINVIVEIPQGSSVKYEIDKESGAIMADRFLYTSMNFPFNYGFVPNSHAQDGDPLDIVLISSMSLAPGTLIASRPIGMLQMEDEAGLDNKIIAVPESKIDPWQAEIQDIKDLNEATRGKIKHFFERYKELEPNKWVKVKEFLGKDEAIKEILKSLK